LKEKSFQIYEGRFLIVGKILTGSYTLTSVSER